MVRAILAGLLLAASATAQMQCRASASPRTLRYYGVAELLADLRLECTGGRAPSPGEETPKYQVVVSADAPLTMRTLNENDSDSVQWTEALLLIDEPSPRDQLACAPDAKVAEEEPEALDCGRNEGVANVFQGLRLQENAVVFRDAPIAPPGSSGVRTLDIVNLRADVRELTPDPEKTVAAPEVYLTVRIFGPGGEIVQVETADQLAGVLTPGIEFQVRTATDLAVEEGEPVLLTTPALTPQGRPETGPTFLVKFAELGSDVFRRRNVGTNGISPTFITSQATLGLEPHTESGFFNGSFPNVRGLNKAGLADSGTRLRVVLEGVPEGVRLWFSYRDVEPGTTGYDAETPKARLTAPEGGVFRPQLPESGEYVEVWASNGRAEALWEVTSSDPDVIESLAFRVGLTGPNRDVQFGDEVISGDVAPAYEEPEDELEAAAEAIPSFDTSAVVVEPQAAFSVVPALETGELVSVSAAAYTAGSVAPGSIVAGFGEDLSDRLRQPFGAPAALLGTTRVDVIDSAGALRPGLLFAVSPGQVNFFLDPKTRTGAAIVTVYAGNRPVAEGLLNVAEVAPGLFSANADGRGAPAGQFVRVSPQGDAVEPLAQADASTGLFAPRELSLGGAGDQAYLVLYGTGVRRRQSLEDVTVIVGGFEVPALYAGEQPQFLGLDQVNAGPLPRDLGGRGLTDLRVRVAGVTSNTVQVQFR